MKKHIFCLILVVAGLSFLSAEASAFSLQLRGGIGEQMESGTEKGQLSGKASGNQTGLNVFIYEGQTWDIFLGAEQVNLSGTMTDYTIAAPVEVKHSHEITQGILGFHSKIFQGEWIKPYFALEILAPIQASSNVEVGSPAGGGSISNLKIGKGAGLGFKAGVGIDMPITERLNIGIEALYASKPVEFSITYKKTRGGNQQIIDDSWSGGGFMDLNLTLRYYF